jgi:hypothetical protein
MSEASHGRPARTTQRAAAYDSQIGRLRNEKVGLAVGAAAGVLLTLAVLAVLVLAGGRDGKRHVSARPAPRGRAFYTLRRGDVARAPLAATRCEASSEAGAPNLFCTRTPGGRYQVIFYEDSVLIYRVGDPDNPRSLRWKP